MPVTAWSQSVTDVPPTLLPGGVRPDTAPPRTPAEPAGPVLDIPPMVDRPLEEDEGDRVEVRRFEIDGAVDRPRHGVVVDEIEALAEELRRQRPEGFTIGQLDAVASQITRYYRERGLILSQAVVPVQTVEDGIVRLEIIEGVLGRLLPEGNVLYDDRTLLRPFEPLVGEPVSQAEVESALLRLTDYPGLAAFGMFQPGQRVGEADMVLRVQNEDRYGFALRGDNHGSEETGEYRARAVFDWNNVTGNADRLTLLAQHSFSPDNSVFGAIEYDRLFARAYRTGGFIRYNEFDVGGDFEDLDISGTSEEWGGYLGRSWLRGRERNLATRLTLTSKRSRTDRAGAQVSEDALTVLGVEATYDSVDARLGGLNFAGIEVSQGFNDLLGAMGDSDNALDEDIGDRPSRRSGENLNEFAEGEFTKALVFYSRLQTVTDETSLLLRTEYQHTDDLLVPVEQYAIGGPDHVRAFPPSRALFDKGGLVSLEYLIRAPFLGDETAFGGWNWNELLQFSVFYDYAEGERLEPFPGEPEGTQKFAGYGTALRFNVPARVESRLQLAWPTEGDEDEDDDVQVWFDLTWHF